MHGQNEAKYNKKERRKIDVNNVEAARVHVVCIRCLQAPLFKALESWREGIKPLSRYSRSVDG
jgi:hypothetical protein